MLKTFYNASLRYLLFGSSRVAKMFPFPIETTVRSEVTIDKKQPLPSTIINSIVRDKVRERTW